MTSSPYFVKIGTALSMLSQANSNSTMSAVSPLAILDTHASLTMGQALPTSGGSPVSLGVGAPDATASSVLYYRITNGVLLASGAGETAPTMNVQSPPPNATASNSRVISNDTFAGTTVIPGMGNPTSTDWVVNVQSADNVTSLIKDEGPGTGGPPSDGAAGTVEIIVNHNSTQSLTAPAIARLGNFNPNTPLMMTTTSFVGTTTTPTAENLVWNIAGDSPAGQQRYLVDEFKDTYMAPSNSGPLSTTATAFVGIVESQGTITFNDGNVALQLGLGVSWKVQSGSSADVILVTPFTSQLGVTEATDWIRFGSSLNTMIVPGSAIPTGVSGAVSSNSWTWTSTVESTSPIPLNGVGTPIITPPGGGGTMPPTPPPTPPPTMG